MPGLFDTVDADVTWRPEAPPSLDGITDIELDFETTGLRWWAGDRPIGAAVRTPDGKTRYLPWGHHVGENIDENAMRRWFQRELRGKHITNINTRFELHMSHAWGVDLEEQGNTFADVAHYAALLDDRRHRFSLEILAADYLKDYTEWTGIDKSKGLAHYYPSQVAAGACQDVHRVAELKRVMWPELTSQDLHRVRTLEEELIPVVCEMERNAAPLNMELLERWVREAQREYEECLWDVFRETGLRVNPDSNTDLDKLFKQLHIETTERTATGKMSFTDEVLRAVAKKVPVVAKVRRAGKLADLLSKYLRPYHEMARHNGGKLRYNLHQLRTDDKGTIRGRFSASDKNIQQVMAVEKQIDAYGDEYIVRDLFEPGTPGWLWLSGDAKQIEYRLFAHYTGSKKLQAAYERNPDLSFHEETWEMFKAFKPDMLYKPLKNMNFAYMYGGGIPKIGYMIGFLTESEMRHAQYLRHTKRVPYRTQSELTNVLEVTDIYHKVLPEVAPLLDRAAKLAENRGFVRTIIGRRARFPEKQRLHSALNAVIQGSAADIMKLKLVELHKERKYTGLLLRFTVHDEIDGDTPDPECAQRVSEVLNRQPDLQLTIPIRWDVKVAKNWARCDEKAKRKEQFGDTVVDGTRGGRSGA